MIRKNAFSRTMIYCSINNGSLRCRRTRGNRHSTRLSVWPWPAEPAVAYLASSGTMGRRSIETIYFNTEAPEMSMPFVGF